MAMHDDTQDSYDAGASNARHDLRGLDDEALSQIVGVLRNYLNNPAVQNKYADAYVAGAMDALAPMLRYVDV